jgi:phage repressor protein C with HTH and peptisase S24 domain
MGNIENPAIGDRLNRIADAIYDGNTSELARALDMKPPSFYKYVTGDRRPGTTVLYRLTQLGINLHWLLTGEGDMLQSTVDRLSPLPLRPHMGPSCIEVEAPVRAGISDESPGNTQAPTETLRRIPLVRVATDEKGSPYLEESGGAEWLSTSFIEKTYGVDPELLKTFVVSGDAMHGSLRAGDRVRCVLWKGESLSDGSIYILHRDPGAVIFRRVRFDGDRFLLTAEHPEVSDISVETGAWNERFRPIAQVVECTRSL